MQHLEKRMLTIATDIAPERGRGGVAHHLASAVDALAAGELGLALAHLDLPTLQVGDGGVEAAGGAHSHGGNSKAITVVSGIRTRGHALSGRLQQRVEHALRDLQHLGRGCHFGSEAVCPVPAEC